MEDNFDTITEAWKRERPDLDPSGLEVVWRISFLHRKIRQSMTKRLADLGLSRWAFDVLSSLRRQHPPYEMSPTQLCESAMLTSGAMTNRLDRLEAEGLVERRPDPRDRRALRVRLTRRGKRLVDRALQVRFDHANDMLASLDESERDQLVRLLRKLVSSGVA